MSANPYRDAFNRPLPQTERGSLLRALGYETIPTFGPLWRDPAFVLACLARYCVREGHGWAIGRSVDYVAREFLADPYAATGEELDAIACLILLGRESDVIPVTIAA